MDKNIKPQTNIERIVDFMERGNPLNQVFVIEALDRYAKEILANKEKVIEENQHSIIHPNSWIKCAEGWQKRNFF